MPFRKPKKCLFTNNTYAGIYGIHIAEYTTTTSAEFHFWKANKILSNVSENHIKCLQLTFFVQSSPFNSSLKNSNTNASRWNCLCLDRCFVKSRLPDLTGGLNVKIIQIDPYCFFKMHSLIYLLQIYKFQFYSESLNPTHYVSLNNSKWSNKTISRVYFIFCPD